jgi:hypothetical protein
MFSLLLMEAPAMRRVVVPRPALLLGALLLLLAAIPAVRAARPALAQPLPTLRGSQPGVYGPVPLHAGLVVVRARSNGAENFAADLVNQDPNNPTPVTQDPTAQKDFYALFNALNRFDGGATALLKQDDNYYLRVSLASAPFEVTFEQPTPNSVTPVAQTTFSGAKWQHVTPYFSLPAGSHTLSVQGADEHTVLRVKLYQLDDLGGAAVTSGVTDYFGDELIDTSIPPAYASVPISIANDGVFIIYVSAEGSGPGNWIVSVQ